MSCCQNYVFYNSKYCHCVVRGGQCSFVLFGRKRNNKRKRMNNYYYCLIHYYTYHIPLIFLPFIGT